ncbi:hypothetical protein PM10SUCC1_28950 [Propionigenium maris DSM 9537]|uniref:Uncharacterized protein n=1 Tax=Propionigenium maris DSM 9537 TaxID=1123000 RepID=A0A9W6GP98_9FUSO|nr:hypothetical protein [Propionigenium maris]GLI57381.1 hypothetical protein PM10SUCC1_28950 [Propionigenium maris DSM 9537]
MADKVKEFLRGGVAEDPNVDPSTGKINLNIPFFELSGVSPKVNIGIGYSYSMNTKSEVRKNVMEWESGLLGVGWNINLGGRILRMTPMLDATKEKYLFFYGGSFTELIYAEENRLKGRRYKSREMDNWLFYHKVTDEGSSYWEIIDDSGISYFFGYSETDDENDSECYDNVERKLIEVNCEIGGGHDKNFYREGTVEYGVYRKEKTRYYPWMSKKTAGSEVLENVWNLSSIRDNYNNATKFYYINDCQKIGEGEEWYTVQSYLYKIKNSNGDYIDIEYGRKQEKEIHIEDLSAHKPNGRQEKISKLYINLIGLLTPQNRRTKEIEYSTLDSEENQGVYNTKRYIKSIRNVINNNYQDEPSFEFGYYPSQDEDVPLALKKITYPTGISVEYEYGNKEFKNISLEHTSNLSGLSDIKYMILPKYTLISGKNKSGDSVLRIHWWSTLGWKEVEVEVREGTHDYLGQYNLAAGEDEFIFEGRNGVSRIFSLEEDSLTWKENLLDADEYKSRKIFTMNKDYIACFGQIDQDYNLVIYKKNHLKDSWECHNNLKIGKEKFPEYTEYLEIESPEHAKNNYKDRRAWAIALNGDKVMIAKYHAEQKKPCKEAYDIELQGYLTLVGVQFSLEEIKLLEAVTHATPSITSFATFGDILAFNTSVGMNQNQILSDKMEYSLSFRDSIIEFRYLAIPYLAARGWDSGNNTRAEVETGNAPFSLYYTYDPDTLKTEEHEVNSLFERYTEVDWKHAFGSNDRNYKFKISLNRSFVCTENLLLVSDTFGWAECPTNMPNQYVIYDNGHGDILPSIETSVVGYRYEDGEWNKLDSSDSLLFYENQNKGFVNFTFFDEDVIGRTNNIDVLNNIENITRNDLAFMVYDISNNTYRLSLLNSNLPQHDKTLTPEEQEAIKLSEIENGIIRGLATLINIGFLVLNPEAIFGILAFQMAIMGVNKGIEAAFNTAIIAQLNAAMNKAILQYGGNESMGRYIVNGNAMLYRQTEDTFSTLVGNLTEEITGKMIGSYGNDVEGPVIPFLMKDGDKITLYARELHGKTVGKVKEVYSTKEYSDNAIVVDSNGFVLMYDNEDKGIPKSYKLFKKMYDRISGDFSDIYVSKSTMKTGEVINGEERIFESSYEYEHIGNIAVLSKDGAIYDTTRINLGDEKTVEYTYITENTDLSDDVVRYPSLK